MAVRLIGYSRNDVHPEYPDPVLLVDESWDRDERHDTWAYIVSGTMVRAFMGLSPCRFCGKPNGAAEFSDGVYRQWPEGLAHYLYEHGVRLPQEFVDHAVARLGALEADEASLDWWLDVTRNGGTSQARSMPRA